MRSVEPNHEKVYIRFHVAIDNGITIFASSTGMKRAAAVRYLFVKYFEMLFSEGGISTIDREKLGFSGAELAYIPQMGRSFQSVRGKSMIVTLDKSIIKKIQLLSIKFGYTENEMRTMIIANELIKRKIINFD